VWIRRRNTSLASSTGMLLRRAKTRRPFGHSVSGHRTSPRASSSGARFASIVCQPHCLAAARLGRAPQFVNPPLAPLLLCRLRHAACPPVITEKGNFALMGADKKDSESKRESAKSDDQATEEAPRSLADNRKRRDGDKDAREQASEVCEVHLSILRRPKYPQCTRPLPSRARSLQR